MMGYGWGMGTGWIVMVVFWVLVVAALVWAVARLAPHPGGGAGRSTRETPVEVLQRRLANGEISSEEYLRIRDQLARTQSGGGLR